MGWLFDGSPQVKTYADEKARIEKICTYSSEHRSIRPLRCSKVGSVWYAAVKTTLLVYGPKKESTYALDAENRYVFAAVFLTRFDQGCWGYKDMDETMGPCEAKAPIGLLNLLSEINDPESYAHKWRERCRAWASIPTYQEGDRIELADAIPMQSGISVKEVEATYYPCGGRKMRCYKDIETGTLVRLSKDCFAGSRLIGNAESQKSAILAEYYQK